MPEVVVRVVFEGDGGEGRPFRMGFRDSLRDGQRTGNQVRYVYTTLERMGETRGDEP
jgi:hypothetical protein